MTNLLQSVAITTVIRLSGGSGSPGMAVRMAVIGILTAVTTASLGIVTVIVIENDPIGLFLIASIAGLMFAAYRGYAVQSQRYANLEKLYELTRKLACSPDLADSMRVTLEEARELVRTSESELVLFQGVDDEGPAVVVRLTADGEVQMSNDGIGDDDAAAIERRGHGPGRRDHPHHARSRAARVPAPAPARRPRGRARCSAAGSSSARSRRTTAWAT